MWEPVHQMSACVSFIICFHTLSTFIWIAHLSRPNRTEANRTKWKMAKARLVTGENPPKWILNAEQLTWILSWKIIYFQHPKWHLWNAKMPFLFDMPFFSLLDILSSIKWQLFFRCVILPWIFLTQCECMFVTAGILIPIKIILMVIFFLMSYTIKTIECHNDDDLISYLFCYSLKWHMPYKQLLWVPYTEMFHLN